MIRPVWQRHPEEYRNGAANFLLGHPRDGETGTYPLACDYEKLAAALAGWDDMLRHRIMQEMETLIGPYHPGGRG